MATRMRKPTPSQKALWMDPRSNDMAKMFLQTFQCPHCDGKGLIDMGKIRVSHDLVRCARAQRLRSRYPALRKVRA
jgi:hypothetical protein